MDNRSNRYNQFNRNDNRDRNDYRDRNKRPDGSGLAFQDSWKQNSVELATVGALVLGAATLAMNGNAGNLAVAGKKAMKAAGKGFNRYLDRRANPVTKLVRDLGIKTYKYLQRQPGAQKTFDPTFLREQMQMIADNVDEKKVQETAFKRYSEDRNTALAKHVDETGSERGFHFFGDMNYYKEKARTEAREEHARNLEMPGFEPNKPPRDNWKNRPRNNDLDNKEDSPHDLNFADNLFGSGVAGLGFGAGITAFHGIDRAVRGWDHDNSKQRAKTFEVAGSFIKEGSDMLKEADFARSLHDMIAGMGTRPVQAIGTGLGYTGISLGTAALLKHHKDLLIDTRHPNLTEDEGGEKSTGPRVIIELGDGNMGNLNPQSMSGYGMSPRLASEEDFGLAKLAGFGNFFKNVVGRPAEMRDLNGRINGDFVRYKDEAAQGLQNQDVPGMAKAQFGHVFGDDTASAQKELFESEADKLRRGDIAAREGLRNEIARDQLTAGGAGLGLIAGGIGLHHAFHRNKEESHV